MTTKITKWGNSLALRIPHEVAKKYRLNDGVTVALTETQKGVLVSAVEESADKKRLPTLQEVMGNFDPQMIEQVDWRGDVGKEVLR